LLTLNFKGTCAKPFKLENVDDRLTIRNVKELCGPKCSLPPDQMRLLFKGVILQDSQIIQETNIADNATLFLVKGAAAPIESKAEASSSTARAQCADPDDFLEDRNHMVAILCIECGVNPGRLLTDGLCSYCFRELVMRENAAMKKRKEEAKIRDQETRMREEARRKEEEELEARKQKNTTRCYKCGKKTGLTGFECKCGYIFCSAHRHAEDHACVFDHKAHGRQILAQQNPKVQNSSWE
jgi:ribosomal protein S14